MVDVLNDGLVVEDGSVGPILITLADDGGNIGGIVRSPEGNPIPDARIILIPMPGDRGPLTEFPTTRGYYSGEFSLKRIPPGEYRILALDQQGRIEPDGYWHDPEFLAQYELRGELITVDPGFSMSINPEAIPLAD